MLEDPPSKKRPTWNVDTRVLPDANVSGSTSVACWLDALVYGSRLIGVSAAPAADAGSTVATNARTAIRSFTQRRLGAERLFRHRGLACRHHLVHRANAQC